MKASREKGLEGVAGGAESSVCEEGIVESIGGVGILRGDMIIRCALIAAWGA